MVPAPKESPERYARTVADLIGREGIEVVLPATDSSMLSLLFRRDMLAPATVPFGPLRAYRALSDKTKVTEAAREIGLSVPRQHVVASSPPDPEALVYPLVLKPSRSVVSSAGRLSEQSVSHVDSPDELRRVLAEVPEPAYPILLQQRIRGPGTGIFLLRWNGETRAVFAHRRLREKPPSGGVSVYRESVAADTDLLAGSEQLLERFDWSGTAMVEFKRDRNTGEAYLMEVNARLWGSLQLAVDAGVDFPRLLVEAALGVPGEGCPDYREGVRSRWWWGEVDHLLARLKGQAPGDAESCSPRRLWALAQFLAAWRPGDRYEVLSLEDPGPFLRESSAWIASLLGGVGER